jgi:AsmA protein
MMASRWIKWTAAALLAVVLLPGLALAVFGWNWLRSPIERVALTKTGRVLTIAGAVNVHLAWPFPHVLADGVTFANPLWASEKQMVTADSVDVTLDLPQLLQRKLVLHEVLLAHPVIYLEKGKQGQKNWLLDLEQKDESARIQINQLSLDHGTLGYDDALERTSIHAELSTYNAEQDGGTRDALTFNANGQYKGLAVTAHGGGGPVLAMRDEQTPYAMNVEASMGPTNMTANGTITSLVKLTALDMHLILRGPNLELLFPLLGIALPTTGAYVTDGHLLHSGKNWRYESFSGRVGKSDIAGTMQITVGGKRPALSAQLVSKQLDFADLGPVIGSLPAGTPSTRVLPELPFKFDRWNSVDAEVDLLAKTIHRDKKSPLENLSTHLSLRDSVLTLDPLNFGIAGGSLVTQITLDGRHDPITATAQVRAKNLLAAKLLPSIDLGRGRKGRVNGTLNLVGTGNSVARMLASSNGRVEGVLEGGEVSKLLMEQLGLHLWEVLTLKLSGDQLIPLRCIVADFNVHQGVMRAETLIMDTTVTTLTGSGTVDLGQEKLALTVSQKTKDTSPFALRSPITIGGSLAKPEVQVDKLRVAARAVGAIALSSVNPLLALIPLVDAGPGRDSDCGRLIHDAKSPKPVKHKLKPEPRTQGRSQ